MPRDHARCAGRDGGDELLSRLMTVLLLGLCACEEVLPEEFDCTADVRVSVTVQVLDSAGGDIAAEVFYDAGDVDGEQACELMDLGGYSCGYEVGGELLIRAQAEGFLQASESVFVESDACHVITESLTLELVEEEA